MPGVFEVCNTIPSTEPISFYRCILRKIKVEPRLGDKHYLALLAGQPPPLPLEDDPGRHPARPNPRFAIADQEGDVAVPKAKPKARGVRARPPAHPPIAEPAPSPLPLPVPPPAVVEPHPPPAPPPLPPPPLPPPIIEAPEPPVLEPPPPVPEPVGPPEHRNRGRGPLRARRLFVPWQAGGEVFFDKDYQEPRSGIVYSTWMLQCPRHERCLKKTRIGPRTTRMFGPIEPLAYLHAWLELPDGAPGWDHVGAEVPADLVRAKMEVPGNVDFYNRTMLQFDA